MRAYFLTAFLMLAFIYTNAQHEVLLSFDVGEAKADVRATMLLPEPLETSYSFTLYPVQGLKAHRRQLRLREKVALNKLGNEWTFYTNTWKKQPHQALELDYRSNLKAMNTLVQAGSHLMLNPAICAECKSVNPFDVRNFRWNALLPSSIKSANLSIKLPNTGKWFSNADLLFTVVENDWVLLNFGEVVLDAFYFYWHSDEALYAVVDDQKTSKASNVVDGVSSHVKNQHLKNKEQDGLDEDKPIVDMEQGRSDDVTRPQRAEVLVSLPAMPPLPRPLDARVSPTIWRFAVAESPYTFYPTVARNNATMAFNQQYNPPFMGMFRFINQPLYERIRASSNQSERWRIAYDAYQNEYGRDEAQIRVLRGVETKELAVDALTKRAFGDGFSVEINRLSVRRNRTQNCIEITQEMPHTLQVVLVFEDSDTTVQLNGTTTLCIPNAPIPKTYYPLNPQSPVEFNLSDGQAFALLQQRGDAPSRYWAMRSLLQSASPYTRATAASFGIDDPLEVIREMAFEASLRIPAFASARMERGWEQIRNEGTFAQSFEASVQLQQKRQSSIELPVNPCNKNMGWEETPMEQMCLWAQRFALEPDRVVKEIELAISNLDASSSSFNQDRLELTVFLDILTWRESL
jgi:hypothetical protein